MAKLNEQEECHGTPLVASYTYSNTRIDDNCERFLSVLLTFIANLKQIKSCCTFFSHQLVKKLKILQTGIFYILHCLLMGVNVGS